eukprot:6188073-Pleurochrysis_carterae.AAC.1
MFTNADTLKVVASPKMRPSLCAPAVVMCLLLSLSMSPQPCPRKKRRCDSHMSAEAIARTAISLAWRDGGSLLSRETISLQYVSVRRFASSVFCQSGDGCRAIEQIPSGRSSRNGLEEIMLLKTASHLLLISAELSSDESSSTLSAWLMRNRHALHVSESCTSARLSPGPARMICPRNLVSRSGGSSVWSGSTSAAGRDRACILGELGPAESTATLWTDPSDHGMASGRRRRLRPSSPIWTLCEPPPDVDFRALSDVTSALRSSAFVSRMRHSPKCRALFAYSRDAYE